MYLLILSLFFSNLIILQDYLIVHVSLAPVCRTVPPLLQVHSSSVRNCLALTAVCHMTISWSLRTKYNRLSRTLYAGCKLQPVTTVPVKKRTLGVATLVIRLFPRTCFAQWNLSRWEELFGIFVFLFIYSNWSRFSRP